MFRFVPSASMKVELLPGQEKWLSTPEKIAKQTQRPDVEAFAIYRGEELVGFALLRQLEDDTWFLWDYAIVTVKPPSVKKAATSAARL